LAYPGYVDGEASDTEAGVAAQRLRQLRTRLDLSQEQLAHRLGVSFATVNRWEAGRTRMSARALRALAEFEAQAGSPPSGASPSSPSCSCCCAGGRG
jgi:transcriptional regulator with XRE-family HTH domain